MSGPVQPPLNVQEDDGSNEVLPTHKMTFDATNFTVAKNGTTARILFIGGGGSATLDATQIGFGNVANELSGSANFTFDGDRTLKFQGATPRLYLGDTDVSTAENEMLLIMKSGSASFIYDRQDAGSLNLGAGDTSNHIIIKPDGEIIINEGGNAEADVRMESVLNENMFMLDASEDKIGIGGSPSNATVSLLEILSPTASASDTGSVVQINYNNTSTTIPNTQAGLAIMNTDVTGGNSHVIFRMQHASGTDGDLEIAHDVYGNTKFFSQQPTTGTVETFRISPSLFEVNEGNANLDFIVNGEYADNMIFADASMGNVGINGVAQSDADLTVYHTNSGATQAAIRAVSTDGGANVAPVLDLYRDAGAAPLDVIGAINFSGNNSTPAKLDYMRIESTIIDETAGTEDATLKFVGQRNSAEVEWLRLQGSGIIFNNVGNSNLDFDYYSSSFSTTDPFIHFDNGNQLVNIGTGSGSTGIADNNPLLQVQGSISNRVPIKFIASGTTTLTLATNEVQGQVLYFEDTGNITLTLPDCVTGDNIKIFVPSGDLTINGGASSTVNGAGFVTRNSSAANALIEVIAVKANTWICDNPTR